MKSQTQVLEELQVSHSDIQCEVEKDWLWITTELGPVHPVKGGCPCDECKARAEKREVVKTIGFRFAFQPHPLPSGKVSRWGHSCLRPTRFKGGKGKGKGKQGNNGNRGGNDEPREIEDDPVIDEAAAFFNSCGACAIA